MPKRTFILHEKLLSTILPDTAHFHTLPPSQLIPSWDLFCDKHTLCVYLSTSASVSPSPSALHNTPLLLLFFFLSILFFHFFILSSSNTPSFPFHAYYLLVASILCHPIRHCIILCCTVIPCSLPFWYIQHRHILN